MGTRVLELVVAVNRFFQRYFPWIIIGTIAIGLRWHGGDGLKPLAGYIVAMNMFVMALKCSPQAFRDALRAPARVLIAVGLLFGLMPLVSFFLARTLLPASSGFGPGLILIVVLPAAVTSSVWTGIAGGNLPLNLTIIGTTTLLSGVVTPALFSLLVGVFVTVDTMALFKSLLVTVMIPVVLGVALHEGFERRTPFLKAPFDLAVKVGICSILFINGSVLAPYLGEWGWLVAGFGSVVVLQTSIAYVAVYIVTRKVFSLPIDDVVAMTFSVGMRNNGAGIVIALAHFGPVVAMPVIFSILVQQPLASLVNRYLIHPARDKTTQASIS